MDGSELELSFVNTYIDSTTIGIWNRVKGDYNLEDVDLKILQGEDINALADRKVKEAMGLTQNQNELVNMLKEKELLISGLQTKFKEYQEAEEAKKDKLDLNRLLTGFKVEYPEINNLAINRSYSVNAKNQMDTSYIIAVNFKPNVDLPEQKKLKSRISRKFCFELETTSGIELDSVSVVNY